MKRRTTLTDTNQLNMGEQLLDLGDRAKSMLRRGGELNEVAGSLGVGSRTCVLAIAFRTAPDVIKLRAMVESWNVLQIRSEIRGTQVTQAT